jgi:hypothetical protein
MSKHDEARRAFLINAAAGAGAAVAGPGLASLPVPISTPGFDAAPYLAATLCITADPDTRIRNIGTSVPP